MGLPNPCLCLGLSDDIFSTAIDCSAYFSLVYRFSPNSTEIRFGNDLLVIPQISSFASECSSACRAMSLMRTLHSAPDAGEECVDHTCFESFLVTSETHLRDCHRWGRVGRLHRPRPSLMWLPRMSFSQPAPGLSAKSPRLLCYCCRLRLYL